jgi:phosphatidylcholine synthase
LLLKPAPWLTIVVIAAFAVLTFLPIRFVHPFRVRSLRTVTVTMLALWALLAVIAVWQSLVPPFWVVAALCLIGVYFLVIGLVPVRSSHR